MLDPDILSYDSLPIEAGHFYEGPSSQPPDFFPPECSVTVKTETVWSPVLVPHKTNVLPEPSISALILPFLLLAAFSRHFAR